MSGCVLWCVSYRRVIKSAAVWDTAGSRHEKTWLVMLISGDRDTEVYLCNEAVRFELVIPAWQIMACVVIVFLLISMIGYMFGRNKY